MYCTQCGKKLIPKNLFCSGCGQKKTESETALVDEQVSQSRSVNEMKIPADPSEPVHAADIQASRPNISKRLLISFATFIIIGAAGLWFWNSVKEPTNLQVATESPNVALNTERKVDTTIASEPVNNITEPTFEASKPAFIQVNQVDSSNYEQGAVDVYFSLFSDNEFSDPLDSENLTKEMFTVEGFPITQVSQVRELDTVSVNLVLDKSGSMMDPPNGATNQSKMDLVRNAAIEFLENVPDETKGQFGVLTFSTFAPKVADISFSSDLQDIIDYLSTLESDNGKTALYDSLTKALYDTNTQNGPKYIIAFTDGKDSEDSDFGSSSQSVVELSRQLGIPIYTVGFGDTSTDLQWISEKTGGIYYSIHEQDDLQLELQDIYERVFQKYVKQYKLTYNPVQTVNPGEEFPITIGMKSTDYTVQPSTLEFTRKIETTSIQVMNGLFEYQLNYAKAVNNLDFNEVSGNVKSDTAFYKALQERIMTDYDNDNKAGKPKTIFPLENYRIESILRQTDGTYKIVFFKLFPLELNQERVFEADLNTYTLVQDIGSDKWQVSALVRNECSIYRGESDPGSTCKDVNGTSKLYSKDPWTKN